MDARGLRKPAVGVALVAALSALGGGATMALTACSGRPAPPSATTPPRGDARAEQRSALPFIQDDYPRALAEARAKNRPLFVDSWATWCHSCQSFRSFVLTDPSLAPLADAYVWLSIDTEKPENAAFVARFTHKALPTLWVIRPDVEAVEIEYPGTLTATELRAMLAAGDEAARRARDVHARAFVLAGTDRAECVRFVAREAPTVRTSTPRADLLATALSCAREVEPAAAKELGQAVDALIELALTDATRSDGSLLADDRSALFEEIVETKRARGDTGGAREIASRWGSFLEREAALAKTPQARAVFDAHRLAAYVALGEPHRAVPMLEQSERELPGDYNAPARLAKAYLEMNRLDDASQAIARAKARVYGPRIMRVLALAADIARARGDRRAEREALEEALARTEKAALTDVQKKARARLAERLADLPP